MSQHSDILSFEISKGISRNLHARDIVHDISNLLDVLEYDEQTSDIKQVKIHAYGHAKWMMTQRDGLYGISHFKLDKFLTQLWCDNQWISDVKAWHL